MPFVLAAAVLGSSLVLQVADDIPKFDTKPSCKSITTGPDKMLRDMDSCLRSEQDAHDQLVKVWSQYTPRERQLCIATAGNFEPTYTELISCLEMTRSAKSSGDTNLAPPASNPR